jgi:hypothetical protein
MFSNQNDASEFAELQGESIAQTVAQIAPMHADIAYELLSECEKSKPWKLETKPCR